MTDVKKVFFLEINTKKKKEKEQNKKKRKRKKKMALVVSGMETFYWIQKHLIPHGYMSHKYRGKKRSILDVHSLLPSLPEGIPICKPLPGVDQIAHLTSKGVHTYRNLLKMEFWLTAGDCSTGSTWLKKHPETVFCNALNNPLAMLLECVSSGTQTQTQTKPIQWKLDLTFSSLAEIYPGRSSISCEVFLSHDPENKSEQGEQVRVDGIIYDHQFFVPRDGGTKISQGMEEKCVDETKWRDLMNIALCAAFTKLTMREHFLYSHLLIVGTIYSLAASCFSCTHPIYMLIHPHGYQTNFVNTKKGPALIDESFTQDWTFTSSGIETLFHQWQQDFHIEHYTAPFIASRAGYPSPHSHENNHDNNNNGGTSQSLSSILNQGLTLWYIFNNYVKEWILYVYPTEHALLEDQELQTFFQSLKSLSYSLLSSSSSSRTFTFHSLTELLTTYIWVAIFAHEIYGDDVAEVSQNADTCIFEKSHFSYYEQIIFKQFFRLVFNEATRNEYKLCDTFWIYSFPEPFATFARDMQHAVIRQLPRAVDYELGINK